MKKPLGCLAVLLMVVLLGPVVVSGATGRLKGRVVDSGGTGVPGARVMLGTGDASAVTNADGTFTIARVEPGTYTVIVELRDDSTRRDAVEVVAGEATTISIEVDWKLPLADTVTVYAVSRNRERIVDAPGAVSTISAQEIERRASHGQLPKLLEFTPGVETTQNGLFDFNFNARGFNSSLNRRVLVLIDGRDPSIPLLSSQAWPAISFPLYTAQNLEFVRGPASALYGADAYNGVMNLSTKSPREHPGGTAQFVTGELDTLRADFSYSTRLGRDWYVKAVGGYYESEDFSVSRVTTTEYPGLPAEVVPLRTDQDRIRFAGLRFDKYIGQRQQHALTLEAGFARYGGPVAVTPVGRIQVLDARHPWARFQFNMPQWNFSASYTAREVKDQISLSTGTRPLLDSFRVDLEAQGNSDFAGGRGRFVGGVQLRRTTVDSEGPEGVQTVLSDRTSADRYSLYGQLDYDFGRRLKAVVAARWDDDEFYDAQFSPKAALIFGITPAHSVRLTYNQAYQAPNFAELFVQIPVAEPLDLSPIEQALDPLLNGVPLGFESVPFLALGNESLDVEQIETYELGYRGLIGRRLVVSADYYQARLDDFVSTLLPQLGTSLGRINPDFGPYEPPSGLTDAARAAVLATLEASLPPEVYALMSNDVDGSPIFATFSYTNVGDVDTEGVEIGLDVFASRRWRINAAYAWFDFDVREAPPENPILPNAPEHKVSAGLTYATSRWDASLQYRWFDDFAWLGGVFAGPVPSFHVVDLYGSYGIGEHWRFGLNVANALDEDHIEIFGGDRQRRRALVQVTYDW